MLAIVTVIAQKLFQNYEYLLFNFTATKSRGITTNDSKDRLHVKAYIRSSPGFINLSSI